MHIFKDLNGLTIAMLQFEIDNDPRTNAERILREGVAAIEAGADVVVGSEMMLSHYVSGDRYEDEGFVDEMWVTVGYISEHWSFEQPLVIGGIALDDHPELGEDGRLRKYNAAFVIQNGGFVRNQAGDAFAIKSLLPNYRFFDDSRHFYDLRKVAMERGVPLESLQQPFPVRIGERTLNLGVMLCEDMWSDDYAQKPALNLAENGADILINLSSSPWSWQKNRKRDRVIRDICEQTALPFVYVNNVRAQNNGKSFIVFDGASTLYDRQGNIVAMAERYVEETRLVTFDLPDVYLGPPENALVRPERPDVAELYDAITVATRGFLGTLPASVAKRVVIGVSGGMDSALSVAFFAKLLGNENVIAVNMPYGDFNSRATKDDASLLCKNLNVEHRVIPIDEMVDARCALTGIVSGSSQHKTAQAIERMSVLAAVAAQAGAFFTCNANMTEIAFGYGTLNGDLRGTFAPWMNCLKQDVYRLAAYMNDEVFGWEVIPQSIIDRPPMDELVKEGVGERGDPFDYGTLTENGYHDQMVRALVAFRRSPEWFLERYAAGSLEQDMLLPTGKLASLFPNAHTFVEDLERCIKLFHNGVFKRVQSVPGPIVDKRSFGWDFRESILPPVRTKRYERLRAEVLAA